MFQNVIKTLKKSRAVQCPLSAPLWTGHSCILNEALMACFMSKLGLLPWPKIWSATLTGLPYICRFWKSVFAKVALMRGGCYQSRWSGKARSYGQCVDWLWNTQYWAIFKELLSGKMEGRTFHWRNILLSQSGSYCKTISDNIKEYVTHYIALNINYITNFLQTE